MYCIGQLVFEGLPIPHCFKSGEQYTIWKLLAIQSSSSVMFCVMLPDYPIPRYTISPRLDLSPILLDLPENHKYVLARYSTYVLSIKLILK